MSDLVEQYKERFLATPQNERIMAVACCPRARFVNGENSCPDHHAWEGLTSEGIHSTEEFLLWLLEKHGVPVEFMRDQGMHVGPHTDTEAAARNS